MTTTGILLTLLSVALLPLSTRGASLGSTSTCTKKSTVELNALLKNITAQVKCFEEQDHVVETTEDPLHPPSGVASAFTVNSSNGHLCPYSIYTTTDMTRWPSQIFQAEMPRVYENCLGGYGRCKYIGYSKTILRRQGCSDGEEVWEEERLWVKLGTYCSVTADEETKLLLKIIN